MSPLAPFRLEPILKEKLWGGRRLAEVLGRPLPPGARVGESWEVSDVGDDVSRIASGPWRGRTLRDLARAEPAALYGPGRLAPPCFPLLVKFIDATEALSIQVHPDDETAAALGDPSGKAEAWVVLHAESGASLWRGLEPGITRARFGELLEAGRASEAIHRIAAAAGDAVYVPPGSVHAIGAGILLYEIQQAADVTYRLDDWGRVGGDGKPRPLQRGKGLRSVDFVTPCLDKRPPARLGPGDELLVACEKFTLRRWPGPAEREEDPGPLGPHVLTSVAGECVLAGAFGEEPLRRGETVLVPHAAGRYRVRPRGEATLLCASAPGLANSPPSGWRRGGPVA
ncbi:MAG: class I mannose-6-phosphate isomerase [Planctomycetales bacterium]|nr:class I mannose-6-phosphate isomerase [Planctomycetales bacterium]